MRIGAANSLLTNLALKNLFHRGKAKNRKLSALDNSHRCESSPSGRQAEFLGEICLHFSGGLETLDKPLIWVYPQVVVCLDCGRAGFTIPEAELQHLKSCIAK
jgi:hypothetical protein